MSIAKPETEKNFEQLSAVGNQLTDEEKKGNLGKMAYYIETVCKSGFSVMGVYDSLNALNKMNSHLGDVESLLDKLLKTTNSTDDIIKEAQEFHTKNCTGVMDNFDFGPHIELTRLDMPNDTDGREYIKTQILKVLKDQQQQQSDNLIVRMIETNCIAAAGQFFKIYSAWNTIKAASNVIEDKNKFTVINEKLQRMESMVIELVRICETHSEDMKTSVMGKMAKINSCATKIITKINGIGIKINGHVKDLQSTTDHAAVDAVANSFTALSQGFQLWSTFQQLSSPTKWLGIFNVAMQSAFGLLHGAVFLISQDKLKELRKDLREADYLREVVENLWEEAENAI